LFRGACRLPVWEATGTSTQQTVIKMKKYSSTTTEYSSKISPNSSIKSFFSSQNLNAFLHLKSITLPISAFSFQRKPCCTSSKKKFPPKNYRSANWRTVNNHAPATYEADAYSHHHYENNFSKLPITIDKAFLDRHNSSANWRTANNYVTATYEADAHSHHHLGNNFSGLPSQVLSFDHERIHLQV